MQDQASVRRVLSIDAALEWAFREEMPKATPSGLATRLAPMWRAGILGTKIDNWARAHGRQVREPHPDAKRLIDAAHGLTNLHPQPFAPAALLAPDLVRFALDPAAALDQAFDRAPLLVAVNARLGRRPPVDRLQVAPVKHANGQVVIKRQAGGVEEPAAKNGRAYPAGAFCPLGWVSSPAAILQERADYAVWYAALMVLAEEMAFACSSLIITPPRALERPWAPAPARRAVTRVWMGPGKGAAVELGGWRPAAIVA